MGRALAAKLGVEFVDLDARVEAVAGKSITDIFADGGEPHFRRVEREVFEEVCKESAFVCALGGGAVTQQAVRRAAQFDGRLVTLRAPAEAIRARLSPEERKRRPLIAGEDGLARLEALTQKRHDTYCEAHDVMDVGHSDPGEVVARLLPELEIDKVLVPLGARSYTVDIGRGLRSRAADVAVGASSCFLVTDSNVEKLWLEHALAALAPAHPNVQHVSFVAGESNKTAQTVFSLWDKALGSGLDRKGLLVALGGGVAGDLGGFVAATLFRGVDVLQLPTSLLAMVDSSVGGKTGFDHELGKNLIGAFHQPKSVICDLDFLSTLPKEERFSGLAEVVKAAWLDGEESVRALEADADALRHGDLDALGRAVRMAVRLKARIVAEDEREGGLRRLLNLGHTVGHALEAAGGYAQLRHGEAISLGMIIAFRYATSRGWADPTDAQRVQTLLSRLALPTSVHTTAEARPFLHQDKKRSGQHIGFVFPGKPGLTRVEHVTLDELETFLANNFP